MTTSTHEGSCFLVKDIFRSSLQQSIHAATFMKVLQQSILRLVASKWQRHGSATVGVLFLGFLCWTCKHQNSLPSEGVSCTWSCCTAIQIRKAAGQQEEADLAS